MVEQIAWIALALVHLTPAVAFLRPSMLTNLYGIQRENPLFVVMHHRSALFAVVLLLCIWPLFDARVRELCVVGVGASMLSFLALYWQAGAPQSLRKIAIADALGVPALGYLIWRALFARA